MKNETPAKKLRRKRYDVLIKLLKSTREQSVDAGICEALMATLAKRPYCALEWNVAMDIADRIGDSIWPHAYFTLWYKAQTGKLSISPAQARRLRRQWVEELITQAKRERDAL